MDAKATDVENSELLKQLQIDRSTGETRAKLPYLLIAGIVAALLLAVGLWYLFVGATVFTVRTAIAQPAAASRAKTSVLDATGYVTARRQATVSSKVTGRVSEVLIEEGQSVKAGQVLARLDATDAKVQLDLARAQLDAANAQLADLHLRLDQAKRDAARQQDLANRKLTSQQAVDDAHTLVESSKARIKVQQQQVKVAERGTEVAQVSLDNTVIKAPFAGVITEKAAQPGEIVSPISAGGGFTRTGIGTIVDMDSLEIQVEVNEAYIGRVQAGQPVETTLNAYPDWKITGEVIAIIPTADRSKATVKVRISIGTKDAKIVPDMGVRVAFMENRAAGAESEIIPGVLVPDGAINTLGDTNLVFVVVDDHAQSRTVKLGQSYTDLRQVLEGLDTGERVIVDPPNGLKNGDRVKLE